MCDASSVSDSTFVRKSSCKETANNAFTLNVICVFCLILIYEYMLLWLSQQSRCNNACSEMRNEIWQRFTWLPLFSGSLIRLALPYGELNRLSSTATPSICLIRGCYINSIETFLLSHPNAIKVKTRRGVAGTILSQRQSACCALGLSFPLQNLCVALWNATMPHEICFKRHLKLLATFHCVYFSFKICYACVNRQTKHVCAFSPVSYSFSHCTH